MLGATPPVTFGFAARLPDAAISAAEEEEEEEEEEGEEESRGVVNGGADWEG